MRSRVFRTTVAGCLLVAAGLFGCATTLLADSPTVFVSRDIASDPDSATRVAAIEAARHGRLLVRRDDGTIDALVDASRAGADPQVPVDVMNPDVSWNGEWIVFSGYSSSEKAWRIYEVGADGTGLRQITRSDRELDLSPFGAAAEQLRGYDDVDPAYLPDGRIVFVSTRYPTVAPDGRRRGTNLFVVDADGSDLHRITTERFGADTPVVDPSTGKIVYSRWWRSAIFTVVASGGEEDPEVAVEPGSPDYGDLAPTPVDGKPVSPIRAEVSDEEFPGLNSWFLAEINPDGTGMKMLSGVGLDRELSQAWSPAMYDDGTIVALFIPRTPFLGLPRGDGLRRVPRGAAPPEFLGGPQSFPGSSTAPGPRDFVYASARPRADGMLLVAGAHAPSSTDYDLYLQDGAGEPTLLYGERGTAETDAVPLEPRAVPPIIEDRVTTPLPTQPPTTVEEAFERGGRFSFLVENIFGNAPVDTLVAKAPPLVEDLTIEFYMNPQRTGAETPDDALLVTRRQIGPSGRVEVELPGGVPLFEVLRTPSGRIPMGRDGQIFHVGGHNFGVAGERARCIGCHAGHSMLDVPSDPTWINLAPSAEITASSTRRMESPAAIDGVPGDPGNERPLPPDEDVGEIVLLRPENLLDLRTEGVRSEWAATTTGASLELRWPTPVFAREVVLYAPRPGQGEQGERNQKIRGLRIITLDEESQTVTHVAGPLRPAGTRVELDDTRSFQRLQVVIRESDVEGLYEGHSGPALAEIEVIGRAPDSDEPAFFVRGDGNCDGQVQMTDAVIVLRWLFQGSRVVCCRAAADTDSSGSVDVTDAVYLLGHLFSGGPAPGAPFPGCGESSAGSLGCDSGAACP